MRKKITISIPTYNRKNHLQKLLLSLENSSHNLVNSTYEFCIIVRDNNSNNFDLDLKKFNFSKYVCLKLVRNKINFGGGNNIIRCIESCDSDWNVILGDDDDISPNFFNIITNKVSNISKKYCLGIYFSSNQFPVKDKKIQTKNDLLEFISSGPFGGISALQFTSSWLLNNNLLKQHLKESYEYSGLYMPHLVMLLTEYFTNDKSFFFLDEVSIVKVNTLNEDSWSRSIIYYSMILNSFSFGLDFGEKFNKKFLVALCGNSIKNSFKRLLYFHYSFPKYKRNSFILLFFSGPIKLKFAAVLYIVFRVFFVDKFYNINNKFNDSDRKNRI